MNLAPEILGKTAVDYLTRGTQEYVLQIGSDQLTREDLSHVGCYNFTAARNLSKVLHDALSVKNLREVYETIPPRALLLPHLGVISLAVLGAAFEAVGIGGDAPLVNYVRKHAKLAAGNGKAGEDGEVTTFATMKQKALRRERAPKRRRRR